MSAVRRVLGVVAMVRCAGALAVARRLGGGALPRRAAMRPVSRCYAAKASLEKNLDPFEAQAFKALGGGSEMGSTNTINWYPGHIAKAERELRDYLGRVDVVVETRDARIASTTAHPLVAEWIGVRPKVVVFTFADMVPDAAMDAWRRHEMGLGHKAFFIDAKRGHQGTLRLIKAAMCDAGAVVNAARAKRGVQARAARAAVIGYPNVGKSALINKLAGRKAVKSENRAGVTRSLSWVRAKEGRAALETAAERARRAARSFELLDSPGIIPARQIDQRKAARLAICGDIGQAAYDVTHVGLALLRELLVPDFPNAFASPKNPAEAIRDRYGVGDPRDAALFGADPEAFLGHLADEKHMCDASAAASMLLQDFRNGRLGKIALEAPPNYASSSSSSSSSATAPPSAAAAANDAASNDAETIPPRPAAASDDPEDDEAEFNRRLQQGDFSGW